jgi:hypothetical protein
MGEVQLNKSQVLLFIKIICIILIILSSIGNVKGSSQEYDNEFTQIDVMDLGINNNEPSIGDKITITSEVKNIDNKNATNFSIILKLNDKIIDSKYVARINPHNKIIINFTWTPKKAGKYKPEIEFEGNVYYDDSEVIYKSIEVKDQDTLLFNFNEYVLIGLISILLIFILIIYIYKKRKSKS